jgi:hypothetical protein
MNRRALIGGLVLACIISAIGPVMAKKTALSWDGTWNGALGHGQLTVSITVAGTSVTHFVFAGRSQTITKSSVEAGSVHFQIQPKSNIGQITLNQAISGKAAYQYIDVRGTQGATFMRKSLTFPVY